MFNRFLLYYAAVQIRSTDVIGNGAGVIANDDNLCLFHGPSMFDVKTKSYGLIYNQSSSIALMKPAHKSSLFLGFHWSPHRSMVFIGQHFVVHLPKRTETSLITESDQSGPNHQLLQLCTARTAWSDSDQAVRGMHSCNSQYGPGCAKRA